MAEPRRYVRLCHRRQRRGGLGAGEPADRGRRAPRSACWKRGRPTGIRSSISRPASSRCCSIRTSPGSSRPSRPKAAAAGAIPTTQGRTLGGSSSINGMIYNRGQRADLDSWAQRGNRGWGYVDMLPYYKRTERRIGIADDRIHGARATCRSPTSTGSIRSARHSSRARPAWGFRAASITTAATGRRASATSSAPINRGYRHSAARVFLHPAKATGRLDVRTDARAAAVLFDGKRATGVRYIDDRDRSDAARQVHARREVILCCGTANTAQAAADLRRRSGRAAGLDRRAGGARLARRGRELSRPLRAAAGGAGEEQHHHQ